MRRMWCALVGHNWHTVRDGDGWVARWNCHCTRCGVRWDMRRGSRA